MKVRFTSGKVRVRLDDLEVAALSRGEVLEARVNWSGGGWTLTLDPGVDGVSGQEGALLAGLRTLLPDLLDAAREGVILLGPPRVDVEKDYGPQHA